MLLVLQFWPLLLLPLFSCSFSLVFPIWLSACCCPSSFSHSHIPDKAYSDTHLKHITSPKESYSSPPTELPFPELFKKPQKTTVPNSLWGKPCSLNMNGICFKCVAWNCPHSFRLPSFPLAPFLVAETHTPLLSCSGLSSAASSGRSSCSILPFSTGSPSSQTSNTAAHWRRLLLELSSQ